mgnify:CR=1 FL=1
MDRILYLDCAGGISGDMAVAALLDLGADLETLKRALDSLSLEGFQVRVTRVKKHNLDACDFDVILDEAHDGHDHDMEYLHGSKTQKSGGHGHGHRGLSDILEIIEKADMSLEAKGTAARIFRILAQAEAKAHGVTPEQVHFHEVGAVDSIVDIVAAAVCLDSLKPDQVIVPALCDGHGTIRCQHGVIPVPVPAVANIVQQHGLPLRITGVEGELVTPTGAAIAAAVRTGEDLPGEFYVRKIGLGAGKREYDSCGFLRAMWLEAKSAPGEEICKLETNIDDCSGETLGYVLKLLFEAGARDVHYTPVFMKKNRPGYQLNVICSRQDVPKMERIIFRETTTIGIRRMGVERSVLERRQERLDTKLGPAEVKVCSYGEETWAYPEYESVSGLAAEHGLTFRQAYEEVSLAAREIQKSKEETEEKGLE